MHMSGKGHVGEVKTGKERKWERILFVPCSPPRYVLSVHLPCRREPCGLEVGWSEQAHGAVGDRLWGGPH